MNSRGYTTFVVTIIAEIWTLFPTGRRRLTLCLIWDLIGELSSDRFGALYNVSLDPIRKPADSIKRFGDFIGFGIGSRRRQAGGTKVAEQKSQEKVQNLKYKVELGSFPVERLLS